MTKSALIICVLFGVIFAFAQEEPAREPSAIERALSAGQELFTKESIVEVDGKKYRRVEYKTDVFYLQLIGNDSSQADLSVLCSDPAKSNAQTPSQVLAAVRVTKRSRLFIEGLKTVCAGGSNRPKLELSADLAVGFMIDDSDDPKAVLKNKKLFINPLSLSSVGFSAEW